MAPVLIKMFQQLIWARLSLGLPPNSWWFACWVSLPNHKKTGYQTSPADVALKLATRSFSPGVRVSRPENARRRLVGENDVAEAVHGHGLAGARWVLAPPRVV